MLNFMKIDYSEVKVKSSTELEALESLVSRLELAIESKDELSISILVTRLTGLGYKIRQVEKQ